MIRSAQHNDVPNLVAADALCNPSPWTHAHFSHAIDAPHDHVDVFECQHTIQAFMVWQHLFDEVELQLIGTLPHLRRCGLASSMMTYLIDRAHQCHAQRIILEVRASNTPAQALYRKHGFGILTTRHGYYQNNENAIIMEKTC